MKEFKKYNNPKEKTYDAVKKALSPITFRSLLDHTVRLTNIARSPIDSEDDVPGLLTQAQSEGRLSDNDDDKVIYGYQAMVYLDKHNPRLKGQELDTRKTLKFSIFNESYPLTNEHPDGSHTVASIDFFIAQDEKDSKCLLECVFTTNGEILYNLTYYKYDEDTHIKPIIAEELDELHFTVNKETTFEDGPDTEFVLSSGRLNERQGQALLREVEDLRREDIDGW